MAKGAGSQHSASGATWGSGRGVGGVLKGIALGERKNSEQGSTGGCRVHLSSRGCAL